MFWQEMFTFYLVRMTYLKENYLFVFAGSFFSFGAGPSGSSVIEGNISITSAPGTSSQSSMVISDKGNTTANFLTVKSKRSICNDA